MSLPTRLSVSSTIMRIRRRRRRSKIGERTSIVESIAYLLMLSYRAQTGTLRCAFLTFGWLSGVGCLLSGRLDAQKSIVRAVQHSPCPLCVFAVAFGPDLVRDDLIDLRLIELDRGAADGA